MNQTSRPASQIFHVTGLSAHADSLKRLASLNPEWDLSPEEILTAGKAGQKIFRMKFTNRPVKLRQDPETGAMEVCVADHVIGCIHPEEAGRAREILERCRVQTITCGIWGGQYKIVDEDGTLGTEKSPLSVILKIVFTESPVQDEAKKPAASGPRPSGQRKPPAKRRKKKPLYKQWWLWAAILVSLAAVLLVMFGSGGSSQVSGTLGSYEVDIQDHTVLSDDQGGTSILINFQFTNHADIPVVPSDVLRYIAYQNGVQLVFSYTIDESVYDSGILFTEIPPDASQKLTVAYTLNSDTAPVEFSLSAGGDTLEKSFKVSKGGKTVLQEAPEGYFSGALNDCTISVVSHKVYTDSKGRDTLLLKLGYTNHGSEENYYLGAAALTATQNGIPLEKNPSVQDADSLLVINSILNVKPGAGIAVAQTFVLNDTTSPVSIVITDLTGPTAEKLELEIQLNQ